MYLKLNSLHFSVFKRKYIPIPNVRLAPQISGPIFIGAASSGGIVAGTKNIQSILMKLPKLNTGNFEVK